MHLEPFTGEEVRQLVSAKWTAKEVSDSFVEFLHAPTDGLALAVVETLALLQDRGDLNRQHGRLSRRSIAELQVPPTVRASVLERVDRLPLEAGPILRAAAVLSAPTDARTLSMVAEVEGPAASAGLAQAMNSGFLYEAHPDLIGFRHAQACRAVEEAIPDRERRRLHGRAAQVLTHRRGVSALTLSRHHREAGQLEAWRACAEIAARVAVEAGDDSGAVELLLELMSLKDPEIGRRIRVAHMLGAAAASGVTALEEIGLRVVAQLRDVLEDTRVSAFNKGLLRLVSGRLLLQLGEFDEAAAQIEAALPALVDHPQHAARAMISLSWPRGSAWPREEHMQWLRRAAVPLAQLPAGGEQTALEVDRATGYATAGSTPCPASTPKTRQTRQHEPVASFSSVGSASFSSVADTP